MTGWNGADCGSAKFKHLLDTVDAINGQHRQDAEVEIRMVQSKASSWYKVLMLEWFLSTSSQKKGKLRQNSLDGSGLKKSYERTFSLFLDYYNDERLAVAKTCRGGFTLSGGHSYP